MKLHEDLAALVASIAAIGGQPHIVGGAVRDWLRGEEPKDFDVEVHKLPSDVLHDLLLEHGTVGAVGRSFGVFKVNLLSGVYDVSLPRRENKADVGHRGFRVTTAPDIPFHEAAARRDFTINAVGWDPVNGTLVDPFHGSADLNEGLLRAVGPAFAEDPLRVLRGFRFCGQLCLRPTQDTLALCAELKGEYHALPVERVWKEWQGWAVRSTEPARGLLFLEACGWIDLYPELRALVSLPQDPQWHPEGSVWLHTCWTANAAAQIATREALSALDRLVLVLAALCHDFGKAATTVQVDGRWVSPGHAQAGVAPATTFLRSIGCPQAIADRVLPLVAEHMCHLDFANGAGAAAGRRLARRVYPGTIRELCLLCEADASGRPPLPAGIPQGATRLATLANRLNVTHAPPVAILLGRHLVDLGMSPGKAMGKVLRNAMEAQIDGVFDTLDGALMWAKGKL